MSIIGAEPIPVETQGFSDPDAPVPYTLTEAGDRVTAAGWTCRNGCQFPTHRNGLCRRCVLARRAILRRLRVASWR